MRRCTHNAGHWRVDRTTGNVECRQCGGTVCPFCRQAAKTDRAACACEIIMPENHVEAVADALRAELCQ